MLQINAVDVEDYVEFHVYRLFCACRFCTNLYRISIDIYYRYIHRSAVTSNTNEYPLFLFEDILQILVEKIGFSTLSSKIFI